MTTPVFEMVDPRTVRIGANVRKDVSLPREFVENIREHGVLEAVTLHRAEDGVLDVLRGQRRTLASIEAGRFEMPALIVDTPEDAERIVTQLVENIHRADMTHADEADAYEQLALLGITAAQIAKKTGRDKTIVAGALKAKASTAGVKALHDGYTIDQALILAEFDGDEDATAELESVIADEPHYLDHKAQKLRDERERARQRAELIATLEAEGKTQVESCGYYADSDTMRITALLRPDGEPATDEDANAFTIDRWNDTEFGVTGWKEQGFTPKYERGTGSTGARSGPMSEEEKEERRTLIANNKAMESATTVRREWVKTLLSRKTAPKGWQYFVLHAITQHSEVTGYDGAVAADMAGAKLDQSKAGSWGWNPLREHVAKSTARPEIGLIALVCAGFEKGIPKDAWRSASKANAHYLTQLVTWGYTPAEVEQIIIDKNTAAADTAKDAAEE